MRLLLVGGSDVRFRLPLVDEFRKLGHEMVLVGSDESALLQDAACQFVRWTSSPNDLLTPRSGAVASLRKIVDQFHPDLVQVFDTVSGLLVARADLPCPVVRTVAGRGRVYTPSGRGIGLWLYGVVNRRSRDGVQDWVFQNTLDREWFIGSGIAPRERSNLIAGSGVDLTRFPPSQPALERRRMRSDLGIDEDAVVALLAARLVKQKGIDLFVGASQHPSCSSTTFLLAGEFPGRPRSRSLGAVRHIGQQDDMPALLAAADMVVLPTRYGEGLPRILLEAAASALPLVATNGPGCGEVVLDRTTGLLVEPSVDSVAGAVAELTADADLRRELGTAAQRHVATDFAVSDVASKYEQLYRDVLSHAGASNGRD